MTSTSMALWVEGDASIKAEESWVEIKSDLIELTIFFRDEDRHLTSESVSKIDELNAALLGVRQRLMASLDNRTFAEVGS